MAIAVMPTARASSPKRINFYFISLFKIFPLSFTYSIEPKDSYAVIHLHGALLSTFEAKPFLEELHEVRKTINRFVVDLQELKHMSSEGLGVLIQILTKARNAGGDAVIINLSTELQQLFIITKLNSIFTVAKDVRSAVKLLAS